MEEMSDNLEFMKITLQSLQIECGSCSSSYSLDPIHIAISKYGAIFSANNYTGYFGTTCPKCLKTIIRCYERWEIDILWAFFSKIHPTGPTMSTLRYFSSTKSIFDNLHQVKHFNINSWEGNSLQNWEHSEAKLKFQELCSDYLCSFPYQELPFGQDFRIEWYKSDEFERLIQIENEDGVRIVPRHYYIDNLFEDIDEFCWTYSLKFLKAKASISSANKDLIDIESRLKYEGINLHDSDEYNHIHNYIILNEDNLQTMHSVLKCQNDIPLQFLKILISDTEDFRFCKFLDNNPAFPIVHSTHLNKESIDRHAHHAAFFREKNPFCGKDIPISMDDYQTDEITVRKIRLYVEHALKALNSYTIQSINDFLNDNYMNFISEYLQITRLPHFSYAEVWELKCSYLRLHNQVLSENTKEESKFAFLSLSPGWKITYNGKTTEGYRAKGFVYLQYIVGHKGKDINYNELYSLKPNQLVGNGTKMNGNKQIDGNNLPYEEDQNNPISSKLKSWLFSLKSHKDEYKLIKNVISDLENVDAEDMLLKEEAEYQIEYLNKYLDQNFFPNGKPKKEPDNHTKMTGTINKAIGRALKEIKKHDLEFCEHIRFSLKRERGALCYNPKENINWVTN